jgi:uncharacterized sulfatase
MIRWPGRVKPQRSDALAMSIDIASTLLTSVGLKPSPQIQGVNLLEGQAVANRKAIFGECFTHDSRDLSNPAQSVRWRWTIDGNWKLIVPDPKNEPNGTVELYDLSDDPHEEHSLADDNQAQVDAMHKQLDQWWSADN